MSAFRVGDRVHMMGEPGNQDDGTVIECSSSFGDDFCSVEWDVSGLAGCMADDLEHVGETSDPAPTHDRVNHPSHYVSDPSGVECITITRHRGFNIGNAIKYLWRAGLKTSSADPLTKQIEDLEKARWYIADEIERLKVNA